jgi:D-ornithine 4,5-aminomutase subunit beta
LCDPSKIQYIDEHDPEDSVHVRLEAPLEERAAGVLRPEVETHGDGIVCTTIFVPATQQVAGAAALEMARHMGLENPEIIASRLMHPAEGSVFEIKGVLNVPIDIGALQIQAREQPLTESEIEQWVREREIHVVAATAGEDEHSMGLQEILDIKHGGIEKYGFRCHYLGTSVSAERLLNAAEELGAQAILISTIVSHSDVHIRHMTRLDELARARNVRENLVLIAGGPQVSDELACESGMDAGFGRGTTGHDVASVLVRTLRAIGSKTV